MRTLTKIGLCETGNMSIDVVQYILKEILLKIIGNHFNFREASVS